MSRDPRADREARFSEVLFVRIDAALRRQIEAAVERARTELPGRRVSKADVVREALERALPR